jgi:dienelactone hydrolase
MKRARTIRPLTLLFSHHVSHHVALACLCSLLIGLTALSGAAMAQNPVPLINQPLVPDAIKPGGAEFTLTVNGTGFVSGSVVHWNGSARATTFVSRSRLRATIPSSDIPKSTTASVTVVSPGSGGGTSNVVFFQVITPSASLTLTSPSEFGAGYEPIQAATGDFNSDRRLDVAVVNLASNNVSILLGNGDGTLRSAVDYAVGSGPISVAVGDFNGDGKLDLAVANSNSNNVSILLGNGDGTFQAPTDYDTGSGPFSVAVGDFNGDGKLDLSVSNLNSNNVSIFLGNGDGTFQAAVDYGAGSGPTSVVVADFNGDGRLDLAVANNLSNRVSVLLGNGDGTLRSAVDYAVGSGPISVAVGDFNGDGKLDLAVENENSNNVSILLGNGDGTFQAAANYGAGLNPTWITVGDFNRDGALDLVNVNLGSDGMGVSIVLQDPAVLLSTARLNFGVQVVGVRSAPEPVTITNSGSGTLNISSITIVGTNKDDFMQTNSCGSSIPPGAHCTIRVTFQPTQLGSRTASVRIVDNAPDSPQFVPLSGIGATSAPNATLSTKSLTFATELVGSTSPAQPVTLSNYGTMTLDIISIVASGDFSESNNCGSSLPPGGYCTIDVTFAPTERGRRTGTVSITDNAPNSPQTVRLKGVATVVELDPASLDFGKVKVGQKSSPQNTILTNVGNTKLYITNIAITGTDAQDFSQTNNCPKHLGGGKSCTITVTFQPTQRGSRSADVSVSDDGGASPQQVSLTGTGCVEINNRCKTDSLSGAPVRSALAEYPTSAVPSPTGPSSVGTRVVNLVDSTRNDPFLANGAKRELLVRFWYPASLNQGCEPAEYTSPKVWGYFSELVGIPLPKVRTNSCLNVPITKGAHPVIVFTHGYTGTFTDYTFIFEDLASRGFVVASVDHTYEATAVEFPDGRLVKSLVGSHFGNSWRLDDQTLAFAVSVRLADLHFMVNELQRLNAEVDGPFAGKLDTSRIALMGHSLGGEATISGMEQETRFSAGVLLDGVLSDQSVAGTDRAILILTAGREQWSKDECRLWSNLRGPRVAVNLRGAEHLTPTDAVWLAKGAIKTSPMGPEKTMAAVRDYIAAFLDTNLRGKPADRLLSGPSSDYPDAAVTPQKQLLCGEGIDH